jgi:hypothetical protein
MAPAFPWFTFIIGEPRWFVKVLATRVFGRLLGIRDATLQIERRQYIVVVEWNLVAGA